ncbi:flagellar biosynthesis anti-sigma factor FlgM [Halalkalibacter sp. APA_J-10(15)]|uniref:flagellar biosynthesis anti-sigma factor FlgM n=1 Tax=unclassified Halalkalibacter TaxID=2893063 RepID=UPI001FF57424|nr:flagellar biosynthesis anti-sigma factor FlgM [Halalkalibacter sp. APA_J-10(15)]MCK0470304.1 flagellar biosynthesis anti-sigma factor FlgM [Halalkalibacter sp. APA_J-10(15)]
MKVNPYQSIQQNVYKKQVDKVGKEANSNKKQDEVQISREALQMQQETQDPERLKKVEALKEQIESGEYKVDPKAVAATFYDYWNQ